MSKTFGLKGQISYSVVALMSAFFLAASAPVAQADVIVAITSSSGPVLGDTGLTGDLVLDSFTTASGMTVTDFTPVGIASANDAPRLFGNTTADAGTASAAVGDANLSTGTLNTGSGARYDLSAGVDEDSFIYIFGNGNGNVEIVDGMATGSGGTTPPGTVTFFDSLNTAVGTISGDFFFQDPGVNTLRAPDLVSFNFIRTDTGGALNSREISGSAVALAEIVFEPGFGFSDIVSFGISSPTTDTQDVGFFQAVVAEFELGDVNCDGAVDLLDVAPFVDLILTGGFSEKADINEDSLVDLLDIAPFVDLLL